MTDKLKESVRVPNWLMAIFAGACITLFATGWSKIDNLQEELTIEKTSRVYIEKSLIKIDLKLDRIDKKLDGLKEY